MHIWTITHNPITITQIKLCCVKYLTPYGYLYSTVVERGWPDYTGQGRGCIREGGLIIQVNDGAALEWLA